MERVVNRALEPIRAFGLSAALLTFGAYLICKALAEIGGVIIPGKNEVMR